MPIKSIKLRFDKWHHSTPKAHLLTYKGSQVWIPRKLCWGFQIAGNDLHALATIPAWLFEKITGHNVEEVYKEDGRAGLKSYFNAEIGTIIEHHSPERKTPVENNTIAELKKSTHGTPDTSKISQTKADRQ